ncbi:DUF803-domain-containing protein [Athelia psychrophila]|uniref:DUF803-domain-containing protein n=1 Tax=Athelia psychrophila TaxID=1759441 RepID=A0A166WXF9_9AGAM|nr:DUF803-domain-containing protein [Fibularhizoctonia sp. CBS 109695]
MSSSASATGSAAAATSSAAGTISAPANLKIVGVILAIISGFLIGSSFVFKKKGLLASQTVHGEGVAYLKSPLWWLGMTMMIMGELCNFAAYAFVEALIVTPLGALSVVVCAILSSIFLKEKLSFFGWLGCALCIVGSTVIALNGPNEASVGQIVEFQAMFLAPGFLAYICTLIAISLSIMFYFGPRHGTKSMFWYISVCSMIGGISVSVTTGLGAAIVTTAQGDNQFKHWFIYFLIVFVLTTLITEVFYLNKALALFNTAMVTPTYYVIFTFCSMATTVILFKGLKSSASQIITIVMGFATICIGITILQMSKVDPTTLNKLDRRSTILLQASRQNTAAVDEKDAAGYEDPGIDTLRGSFGAIGSIIRANTARRMSRSSRGNSSLRNRTSAAPGRESYDVEAGEAATPVLGSGFNGMTRHQLYDAPVPRSGMDRSDSYATSPDRRPTIKFDPQDLVHQYNPTGQGELSTHEARNAHHGYPYPPIPNTTSPSPLAGSPRGADISETNLANMSAPVTPDGRSSRDPPRLGLPAMSPSFYAAPQKASTELDRGQSLSTLPSADSESSLNATPPWEETVKGKGHTHRYGRSYPRGDDDREESVHLWDGDSRQSLDDDDTSAKAVAGGIRLVNPSEPRY